MSPVQEAKPAVSSTGAGDRALAWLAIQQNPDGSWGREAGRRPELTGIVLLSFMELGEGTGYSAAYSERLIRGFEKAIEYSRDRTLDANGRAVLLCALAYGWSMTLNPNLRQATLELANKIDSLENSAWLIKAQRELLSLKPNDGAKERLRLIADRFPENVGLYEHACRTACMVFGRASGCRDAFDSLCRTEWCDWRKGRRSLQTAAILHTLMFCNGGRHYDDWRYSFVADVIKRQIVDKTGEKGWWTASGLGIPRDPDALRFSKEDEVVYTTAIIASTLYSGSTKPSTQYLLLDFHEALPEPTDSEDIRIELGNL
jgi:hypothetical protein